MGFTPQEVGRMSVWQFLAARDGFIEANNPNSDKTLTESEKDELWTWVDGN